MKISTEYDFGDYSGIVRSNENRWSVWHQRLPIVSHGEGDKDSVLAEVVRLRSLNAWKDGKLSIFISDDESYTCLITKDSSEVEFRLCDVTSKVSWPNNEDWEDRELYQRYLEHRCETFVSSLRNMLRSES